jgi:hypothetical protein
VANEGARVMAGPFAVEQQVLASIAVFPRVRLHVMPATDQRSIKGLLRTLTDPARLDALSKSGLIDSVSEKILIDGEWSVEWDVDGDTLVVTWRETHNDMDESSVDEDGADAAGFGTTRLKLNIEQKLGGTQERVFSDKQMSLILQIPVSALES